MTRERVTAWVAGSAFLFRSRAAQLAALDDDDLGAQCATSPRWVATTDVQVSAFPSWALFGAVSLVRSEDRGWSPQPRLARVRRVRGDLPDDARRRGAGREARAGSHRPRGHGDVEPKIARQEIGAASSLPPLPDESNLPRRALRRRVPENVRRVRVISSRRTDDGTPVASLVDCAFLPRMRTPS